MELRSNETTPYHAVQYSGDFTLQMGLQSLYWVYCLLGTFHVTNRLYCMCRRDCTLLKGLYCKDYIALVSVCSYNGKSTVLCFEVVLLILDCRTNIWISWISSAVQRKLYYTQMRCTVLFILCTVQFRKSTVQP